MTLARCATISRPLRIWVTPTFASWTTCWEPCRTKHPEVPQFPYTHESYIHEPFTLMAYLAAVTKRIGLTTGILILPQRQTALVAKQAAEVDLLSGGRLRLGIGVGWNSVEYEALGVDFATRGSRCDEQIEVLRQLVDRGRDQLTTGNTTTSPTPASTRCPCNGPFQSGSAPAGATLPHLPAPPFAASDGWPTATSRCLPPTPTARPSWAVSAHRPRPRAATPSDVGIEGRITITADNNPEDWLTELKSWEEIGASHVAAGLRGAASPDDHIDAIRRLKEATG